MFFWSAKFEVIIIIIKSYFQALNWICVWTPTGIDLKFSGDLQRIKIYFQEFRFYKNMFWRKVNAQNCFSMFLSFGRHLRVDVNSDQLETLREALKH